jgi:hypothetical protein
VVAWSTRRYNPESGTLIVTPITCSIVGQQKEVRIDSGSRAATVYGAPNTVEAFYCNYGLSPDYQGSFERAGFRITGRDENGEARIVELPTHPFYIATLFVPQANSTILPLIRPDNCGSGSCSPVDAPVPSAPGTPFSAPATVGLCRARVGEPQTRRLRLSQTNLQGIFPIA